MKKNYAFYCSGNAGRILKFYDTRSIIDFPVKFVFYDGEIMEISKKLEQLFGDKLLIFRNEKNLKGIHLSQYISNLLLKNMQTTNCNYLFCFGNMILKQNLIDLYQNKIINFHPSILPSFPGLKAIDQALASSVQLLGNTAHFVDKGIDTGPIIIQSVIKRTFFTDYEDVLKLQLPMLEKIWLLIDNDRIEVKNNLVHINSKDTENNHLSSN
jgi:phosphoribosylglycinamide formyltransferase-1